MNGLYKWSPFLLTLFVLGFVFTGCASTPPPKTEPAQVSEAAPKEEPTLYQKIATVGEGRHVTADSDITKEYEWYLIRLAEKTIHSEQQTADITVKTWQMLQDDVNPNEYLLDVLKTLYELIPRGSENVDLAEVAGLYIILRMND